MHHLCAELSTIECRRLLREQVELTPRGLVTEISRVHLWDGRLVWWQQRANSNRDCTSHCHSVFPIAKHCARLLSCTASFSPHNNHATVLLLSTHRTSNLLAALCHTGRRRVVLSHPLITLWHVSTKNFHNVLSKFTILCWAALTAIPGRMRPVGYSLDTPGERSVQALLLSLAHGRLANTYRRWD